jgi:hypothetical protein
MEPTTKELRIAFEELRSKMGLKNEDDTPLIFNKEYSRDELLDHLQKAKSLINPLDKFTVKTRIILLQFTK